MPSSAIRGIARRSSARAASPEINTDLAAGIRTIVCYHLRHMILITPADVVGDGAVHTLASISGAPTKCKWFQFIGISIANSSTPGRLGDSHVSLDTLSPVAEGRGITIPANGGQFSPPVALAMEFYDLTQIYYVLASGDKAQFAAAV